MRERVDLKSPVRENRPPGSVRGAPGNRRPYRDRRKGEGYTSRGHFTRKPVRTSVNTGDFVHLTRKITRKEP